MDEKLFVRHGMVRSVWTTSIFIIIEVQLGYYLYYTEEDSCNDVRNYEINIKNSYV